ncbi:MULTISPECIES: hypothetical protein [Actinosynnema]|uniref:hypothetical protein n=1 Tax=Actinosynnema TaxID=40566 RepID=UPI0020A3E096|nr:hypothetical protein [Actinosynnema pretiosum]MCP2097520.1 hypothetical protein [Actinosynnema pretiosum]
MIRARLFGALLLATVAAVSGCTTTVDGIARPKGGSTATSATTSGPAVCDRSPDPNTCAEFQRIEPAQGQDLFAAWASDEVTSSQMLCSALSDQDWRQWLGEGFYRYVSGGGWCELWSADDQVAIKLGLYGASPLRDYLARFQSDPRLAQHTRQIQIASVPAMTTGLATDADGVGRDGEQITLAPHGGASRPGVLLIHLELRPPRGKPDTSTVDRSRIAFRNDLAGALLGALFPL